MVNLKSISLVLIASLFITIFEVQAQSTGLSGWSIYLDPGHSQKENMGLYNYSEAEKVLRVALHLRDMLNNQTDIDTVYISRTNDSQLVSLSQRTTHANTVNADFFYSIHSDAGAPSANSTLMLWGGWRSDGVNVEKTPTGGKKMGDIMTVDLTASMRIPTRGGYYDRTFYDGFPHNHTNKWPYLHVNRVSNMASVLSEAGFHTNPTQQQRNLNAEWKKLEAQSAFWSILEFHGVSRPPVGIATGFIRNLEGARPINGANITIGDISYTTDTFESLFSNYSNNPDQLANGFYYIENLTPNEEYDVFISAPGFYADTIHITVNPAFFTFADVNLVSSMPPSITATFPAANSSVHDPHQPIEIHFSRPMYRPSVEEFVSISPILPLNFQWINDQTLRLSVEDMNYDSDYVLTISPHARDQYWHFLDGNADGTGGDAFELPFRTAPEDITPPSVLSIFPETDIKGVEPRPIITVRFDELILPESVESDAVKVSPRWQNDPVAGQLRLYSINNQSVLQFFPSEPLLPNTYYDVTVSDQITDLNNNRLPYGYYWDFMTGEYQSTVSAIDAFNSGIAAWWEPQQSGSTSGIVTELTSKTHETTIVNPLTGSTGSMKLSYGWDVAAGSWLIREYLPPAASQNLRFDKNHLLEATIFGDGSGNRFRFMLRDGNNQLEGSPWFSIDWLGWKRISWDMRPGTSVGWVNGNGSLDGTLYTDSFQLTYTTGANTSGAIYIDNYQVVNMIIETSGDYLSETPDKFALLQNYPNPFNPATTLAFVLAEPSHTRLTVYDILGREVIRLTDQFLPAGRHQFRFDASSLSSGLYIYKLESSGLTASGKMMLLK